MDRKQQLGNVAFGGAWSEQIPRREEVIRCIECLEGAESRAPDEDLREDLLLQDAVAFLFERHPKGRDLRSAWAQAMCIENPGIRSREVGRVVKAILAWNPSPG